MARSDLDNFDIADEDEIDQANTLPKKHFFLPSCNFIWEIKSKKDNRSYFIDSKREYCTCKGYYYNFKDNQGCYHLGKISKSIPELRYKIYLYHDDYFKELVKRIVIVTVRGDGVISNI